MLKRIILPLCLGLLLPAMTLAAAMNKPVPQPSATQVISRTVALPSNSQNIQIRGRMNVKILAGLPDHDLRIIGAPNAVKHVRARFEGNNVEISTPLVLFGRFAKPLTVIIRTTQVYSLSFHGDGDLEGIDLNSPHLKLDLRNDGQVNLSAKRMGLNELVAKGPTQVVLRGVDSKHFTAQIAGDTQVVLRGEVVLQRLELKGNARFDAQWVHGSHVNVIAGGQAQAQLAGNVGTLEMTVRQQAGVNARYLRTQRNYIKTYNEATARIQTSNHQYALARDASNIYYFKTPFFKASMMAGWGSVLDFNGMT